MEVQNTKMGLLLFLTCVCILAPVYQTKKESPDIKQLAIKNMDFAMNLYRKISSYHDKNIFFSPLSISTAFSVLSMGSGGLTREEILRGLNLAQLEQDGQPEVIPELFQFLYGNITEDGSLKLDQGTDLFIRQHLELQNTFSDDIHKFFKADIHSVNFEDKAACINNINEYIKQKTKNKVTKMISDLDEQTQILLISTIFFQGVWKMPFNSNLTEMGPFFIDSYNIVQVPMMFKEDRFYTAVDAQLGSSVLKLPYKHGVSMLILLPNKDMDYTTIDDEISAEKFLSWVRMLRETRLEVKMPKFKMEQSYALHHLLPAMGISSVFTNAANLTRLTKEMHLKVSEVLHKAVVEVDETGTTAAAATTVGITPFSLPPVIAINRPFFFFIYHEDTNSLLFMGRVIDPTKL